MIIMFEFMKYMLIKAYPIFMTNTFTWPFIIFVLVLVYRKNLLIDRIHKIKTGDPELAIKRIFAVFRIGKINRAE